MQCFDYGYQPVVCALLFLKLKAMNYEKDWFNGTDYILLV